MSHPTSRPSDVASGRLDWRQVEHLIAEELRRAGYEVDEQEPTSPGGDLVVEALFRQIVEVRSVNVRRVADPGDAAIFHGPRSSLRRHWRLAEEIDADGVIVVGVDHDGEQILATGALDGRGFEARVEAARSAASPRKLLRPVRISEMQDIRTWFRGVALPPYQCGFTMPSATIRATRKADRHPAGASCLAASFPSPTSTDSREHTAPQRRDVDPQIRQESPTSWETRAWAETSANGDFLRWTSKSRASPVETSA